MFWKRLRRRRNSPGYGYRALLLAISGWLLLGGSISGTDKLKDLQDRFDKDNHAGSKVKSLARLGDAQFDTVNKAIQANDYVTAGFTFEKYRDNVRATLELLKKQEPDVDRHPSAYRQLELELRKGIREVEEAQIVAPPELRPPLGIVRKDLIEIDDELIRLLFPRRSKDPDKSPANGKPGTPEVKP